MQFSCMTGVRHTQKQQSAISDSTYPSKVVLKWLVIDDLDGNLCQQLITPMPTGYLAKWVCQLALDLPKYDIFEAEGDCKPENILFA